MTYEHYMIQPCLYLPCRASDYGDDPDLRCQPEELSPICYTALKGPDIEKDHVSDTTKPLFAFNNFQYFFHNRVTVIEIVNRA